MNNLTKALLGGAALCALANVSAIAQNKAPKFHIAAVHGGHVINKTKMPNHGATHITYTFGVYSYVPASNYRKTVTLAQTFFYETYEPCAVTWEKMTAPKKSELGKIGIVTETYVCGNDVKTVLYGNSYKLTDPDAKGKTDHFVSTLLGKFKNNGAKYKATVRLDVDVFID